MAKKSLKGANGTSFHFVTFRASVNQLVAAYGEPNYEDNSGSDKVNFEWEMETDKGDVFTLYDWKYYRPIRRNEQVDWHIGSVDISVAYDAKAELTVEV